MFYIFIICFIYLLKCFIYLIIHSFTNLFSEGGAGLGLGLTPVLSTVKMKNLMNILSICFQVSRRWRWRLQWRHPCGNPLGNAMLSSQPWHHLVSSSRTDKSSTTDTDKIRKYLLWPFSWIPSLGIWQLKVYSQMSCNHRICDGQVETLFFFPASCLTVTPWTCKKFSHAQIIA